MSDRDEKGLFLPGNSIAKSAGRPKDAGKQLVKDLVWEKINNIVELLFNTPEHELKRFLKENEDPLLLSRAERLYLEQSTNLAVIEALLDRVIGKTLALDNASERDPIIERLYKLGPAGVNKDIDALIEAREIINAEYKSIGTDKKKDSV